MTMEISRRIMSRMLMIAALARAGLSPAYAAANENSMERLRADFAKPRAEHRAVPLAMEKLYKNTSEYLDKLVQGRWGGGHCEYPVGGKNYLCDTNGWNRYKEIVAGCRERGLQMWIYDESGYPSGRAGGQALSGHLEFEAQGLFYDSKDVAVRQRKKEDPAEAVLWQTPTGTPFYVAAFPIGRTGQIDGKPIDLTGAVTNGEVKVSLPPGSWRLIALVQNRIYDGTHAALTGPGYLNILDPEAVKRFIEITHESYYAHCGADFGKTLAAIFNDEVSLMTGFLCDDSQPHPVIAWYHGLPEIFRKRNGYDIRECLPALFDDVGAETTRKRCEFYAMLGQQVADSFFKQIREWCAAHNIASIGHLLWEESLVFHAPFYGTVFPSYKELDWPGIDELDCEYGCTSGAHVEGGPVTPKLASSAAHVWNKPRTMSESFCYVGGRIPKSVEEYMQHYQWQAVLGINALTILSIWRDVPDEDLGRLNDFVGRVNTMVTRGRFTADVAILYPIASVWDGFIPTTRHVHNVSDNPIVRDVDESWRWVSSAVLSCQRDFDYLDETLIQEAKLADGKLTLGQNRYSVLVLPHVTTLGFATLQKIKQFVEQGGTVISWKTLPTKRADAGSVKQHQALVEDLWNNHKDRVIQVMTEKAFRQALNASGTPDLVVSPATPDVYYQHRILPEGDLYFLVNNAVKPVSGSFDFRASGRAELWDPVTGKTTSAALLKTATGSSLDLTMSPRSSLFVVITR